MKKFLLTAAAMMMIFSCTKKEDELLKDQGKGTGTVGVRTEVSSGTRGVALNSNDDLITTQNGFDLFGIEKTYDQDQGNFVYVNHFMGTADDGVEFTHETGKWDYADQNEVVFWQELGESHTVDFYAVSPTNEQSANVTTYSTPNISGVGEDEQIIEFEVNNDVNLQEDLMYARTQDVNNDYATINNGIELNFHHALSQIVFGAKIKDGYEDHISAEIESISICNLYGVGSFSFSDAYYSEYGNNGESPQDFNPWTIDEDAGKHDYIVSYSEDENLNYFKSGNILNSNTPHIVELTNSNTAMLLLPQEIVGDAMTEDDLPLYDGGAYIHVMCKVYYNRDGEDPLQIVGVSGYSGSIYIPLTTQWHAGYKYRYTLVFSKDMADPVSVNEQITVEEWYEGGNTDIPGENEGEGSDDDENGVYEDGTLEYPFIISSAEELMGLAAEVNAGEDKYGLHYYIENENDISEEIVLENWIPIGNTKENKFAGNLRAVSPIRIASFSEEANCFGLVGYNVGDVFDVSVRGNWNITANKENLYVGGLVAYNMENGSVYGCKSELTINVVDSRQTSKIYVGGLSGYNGKDGIVSDSKNYSTINVNTTNVDCNVGGISGYTYYCGLIRWSENHGSINVSGTESANVGGIVGCVFASNYASHIYACSSYSDEENGGCVIEASGNVGGIVGYVSKADETAQAFIAACFSGTDITAGSTGNCGGIVGNSEVSGSNLGIISTYNVGSINAECTKGQIIGCEKEEGLYKNYYQYVDGIQGTSNGDVNDNNGTVAVDDDSWSSAGDEMNYGINNIKTYLPDFSESYYNFANRYASSDNNIIPLILTNN